MHAFVNFFINNGIGQNLVASPIWAVMVYLSQRAIRKHLKAHHESIRGLLHEHLEHNNKLIDKALTASPNGQNNDRLSENKSINPDTTS